MSSDGAGSTQRNRFDLYHKKFIPAAICSLALIFYWFLILHRYYYFGYVDWDAAFYNQSLWNLLRGQCYSSIFDFHCLGSHAEIIRFLILPFFSIFPHPLTYSFIQLFSFVFSAWILFLIARDEIGDVPAVLIMSSYLIFPPNLFALTDDHNFECMAPLLIMLSALFYKRKTLVPFYVSLFILCLVKENMPLIVGMFGIWGILSRDRSRISWGLIPILFSSVYFITIVKWVIPYFRGMVRHSLWTRFSHIGATPKEILFNLAKPKVIISVIFSTSNFRYLLSLFGALLIPAFMSLNVLLLVLPILGYHLISNNPKETSVLYYYSLALTPGIFLATVATCKKRVKQGNTRLLLSALILLCSICQYFPYENFLSWRMGFLQDPFISERWRMVSRIPLDAPVVATFEFLPALSLRSDLHSFHKIFDRQYQDAEFMKRSDFYTGKIFVLPDNVHYALINFHDGWLENAARNDRQFVLSKLDRFFQSGWIEIDSAGPVRLFYRKN